MMKSKAVSVFLLVFVVTVGGWMIVDYLLFRYQGDRFTGSDGRALCQRVQALDGAPCPTYQR